MAGRYPRSLAELTVRLTDPSGRVLDEDREISFSAHPRSVEWISDEPSAADSCHVVLDWRHLPVDPRMVSDLHVRLYADDIVDPDAGLVVSDETLRFIGYVDLPSMTHDESGATLTLEARDFSGRLRDSQLKTRRVITDIKLSQALVDMAGEVPGYTLPEGGFALGVRVEGNDPKIRDVTGRSRWTPPENARVWDAMQALAREVGMVCEMDRRVLVVRPPRGAGGNDHRRMLFGENVSAFTLERSLQPGPLESIELRGLSSTSRRIIKGRFPPAGTNPKQRTQSRIVVDGPTGTTRKPRQQTITEAVRVIQVPGHFTQPQLVQLAEALYRRTERQQAEGTLETVAMRDLDSWGLPGLRSGMSLYVDLREREANPLDRVRVLGYTRRELADLLVARGMDPEPADALAEAWVSADDAAPVFYVRRARHRLDNRQGYRLTVDIESFLIPVTT